MALTILLVVAAVSFMFSQSSGSELPITGNVIAGNDDVQKITLSMKNYNYYPQEIKVKANKPVSISLDGSVQGCLRAFTIREMGVSKYLKTPAETIDFTPTQKGTFKFACSMGMGYGNLIVE